MISLIIPCKNEEGTIYEAIKLGIELPGVSEIIVVEGQSSDNTSKEISKAIHELQSSVVKIKNFVQNLNGKWNAVKLGIENSVNENISIWDADLTVSFREQCLIHERFLSSMRHRGVDCLSMGDRMSKREPGSMRLSNFLGNIIFAKVWTLISGIKINDTLCGSKIFNKNNLNKINNNLLEKDPYGDFSIILASILNGKEIEIQKVTYRARTYGQTNILRWSGGLQLFLFSVKAFILVRKNMSGK